MVESDVHQRVRDPFKFMAISLCSLLSQWLLAAKAKITWQDILGPSGASGGGLFLGAQFQPPAGASRLPGASRKRVTGREVAGAKHGALRRWMGCLVFFQPGNACALVYECVK